MSSEKTVQLAIGAEPRAAPSAAAEAEALPPGTAVGRYSILGLLGRGGMGVVYKAYDPELNRGVALKLMSARKSGREAKGHSAVRLLREAQALAQLAHPNVVTVHDVGTFGDDVFVAMELVEGDTVAAWLKQESRSLREIMAVLVAAGRGLAQAHRAGLVHRDFKPDNVIIGRDGRVRVIDFGLARAVATSAAGQNAPDSHAGGDNGQRESSSVPHVDSKISEAFGIPSSGGLLDTPVTRVGARIGTPAYMTPEQFLGEEVSARADQYSFCVVLYEACYGQRPFRARSLGKLALEVVAGRVPAPPPDAQVPPWLRDVMLRGLSANPDERYPSMEVLLEELREDPDEVRRRQRAASKRKLFVIGSVVLAVMAPLGLWYGLRVRTARLCQATQGELGGVWDSPTKEAIRMAFLDTNKSYAADTWQRLERALDTYTAEWTHMRAEACSATWLRGTQSEEVMDLRMSCLSKRIGELRALVKIFARADAGVVQKAVQASSSLAGIAICADEEALSAPIPPPKSAEAKAKVAAIREKLAEVEAFSKTGKFREGRELVRKLEKEANAVGYRLVQAEVLSERGSLLEKAGEYEKAETTLYDAAHAAGKSGDGLLAAKAMAWLVRVVGYSQARHEAGMLLGRAAEAVLGLGGGDDALRSRLLNNLGAVSWKKGEYDEALESFRKALAIREKLLGPEHPDVAHSLHNMGVVFTNQVKYDKAREYLSKSLAVYQKVLGPEHPAVAMTLNNMGEAFRAQGQYDKALEYRRKALAIWETALGPEHPDVAAVLNNIGVMFRTQGEYDQALEYCRKALAIREKALGPLHPDVVESLRTIGKVFVDQGRHHDALAPLERAVRICGKKTCKPENHGRALLDLAQTLVATDGDNERAITLAAEARRVFGTASYLNKELEEVDAWLKERGGE